MEIQRKALYNLIRMNWLHDRSTICEPWQIEEYRNLTLNQLFTRLNYFGLPLDEKGFMAYGDEVDTPEELTDMLLGDIDLEPAVQDQIYLHIFEIWRRLFPERMTLSVFCDQLDHHIFLYDRGEAESGEDIQDALANLQSMLDENVDQGGKPLEVFQTVSEACAHDLESFLYDYIAEQIDNGSHSYASELLEGFDDYLKGSKWFDLLKIREKLHEDPEVAHEDLRRMLAKAAKENDLEFNLEILTTLIQYGEKGDFNKLVKKTAGMLETEDDFQELLQVCADFYRRLDEDGKEKTVLQILSKRSGLHRNIPFKQDDPDAAELLKALR